jgi:hypothetical protein
MVMPVMAGKVFYWKQFLITPNLPLNLCIGSNDTLVEPVGRAIGIRTFLLKPVFPCNPGGTSLNALNYWEGSGRRSQQPDHRG